jgi:predicted Zn finger-like uncharacterized protein
MYLGHLSLLACPDCRSDLRCTSEAVGADGQVIEGKLRCAGCSKVFPVIKGIPRFVPRDNYASGFGLEWIRH